MSIKLVCIPKDATFLFVIIRLHKHTLFELSPKGDRHGCPIELISDQGNHFLNSVVKELTQHYAVVHKKSTPYYPQANGLAESTNKTLQNILKKIVNENRTDWDTKLYSALWAYRTSYKTSIQSTPFRLAFGLEAVMPVEFQVPSLRIQIRERLPE